MKNCPPVFTFNSLRNFFAVFFILHAFPAFAQKPRLNRDSLNRIDSIREFMFRGALLSMDALQAKYESQRAVEMQQKQQKAGESQNLFFQSRAYYRKAIVFDKNYYPAWTNMGTTYFLQDLPRPAISCYQKAISINADYASAWFNLGKAYAAINMKDSAAYSYKECIRADSTSLQAYQELSRLIMATQKDFAAAMHLLRLSAYYKPSSEVPWVSMSALQFSYGDSANGIASLEHAAMIYPGDVERLKLLVAYFKAHGDAKKSAYYSNLLAVEIKKQEIPEDKEKR